jgi:2-keto-3-deoxy-6-phosphogluconate aldolase
VGGSWLTPADKVNAHDWTGIEAIARFTVEYAKT